MVVEVIDSGIGQETVGHHTETTVVGGRERGREEGREKWKEGGREGGRKGGREGGEGAADS